MRMFILLLVYLVRIFGQNIWFQQATLSGNDAFGTPSNQGASVALSYDASTIAIGGPSDNSWDGAIWIYRQTSPTTWIQDGPKLVGSRGNNNLYTRQGTSVSLNSNGDILAASGYFSNYAGQAAIWIFTRNDATGKWSQQGQTLSEANFLSYSSPTVTLSARGNYLILAGTTANILYQENTAWNLQATFQLTRTTSVGSINSDGSVAIVGIPSTTGTGSSFRVFERSGQNWTQRSSFNTTTTCNKMVYSSSGNTIATTTSTNDTYIYNTDGKLQAQKRGVGWSASSSQGSCISLVSTGDYLIETSLNGEIWQFAQVNSKWYQQGAPLIVPNSLPISGCAISGDGKVIVVGSSSGDGGFGISWVYGLTPVPSTSLSNGLGIGAAIGITLLFLVLALALVYYCWLQRRRRTSSRNPDIQSGRELSSPRDSSVDGQTGGQNFVPLVEESR